MEIETGVVKKFFEDRGFGFIQPDAHPEWEIFVHWRAIEEMDGYRELRAGDRVEFSMGSNSRGECAVHVRLLEDQEAAAGGDSDR